MGKFPLEALPATSPPLGQFHFIRDAFVVKFKPSGPGCVVAFVLGGFLTSIQMCPLAPGQLSRARGQSGDLEHHGPCIPGD